MARVLRNPKIGAHCYEPFRPAKAGKVMDIRVLGHENVCTIRWVDGTESEHVDHCLQDFDALIEETRKKVRTHEATLAKLNMI